MSDILTVTCISPRCNKTKTGPREELVLWRCDEHAVRFEVGERVIWNNKRYEVLTVEKNGIRIRTGARNGKLVERKDIKKT